MSNGFRDALGDYVYVVLRTVAKRESSWGSAWDEMRNEGLEDHVHAKAHRLCNCSSQAEKRECLVDMLAYAAKRWERGFDEVPEQTGE
jgi:hypothetical protein